MGGWWVIILTVIIVAFAAVMAVVEMRSRGSFSRRPSRPSRKRNSESEIIAILEAEGFAPEEIAFALSSDGEPEIVPVIVHQGCVVHSGLLPTLGLRVRSITAKGLERAARRAASRALSVDPTELIVDVRETR